jgi:hypothetical protein
MKTWPKRIRGAVLLGLAWAVAWAPLAVLIGLLIVDPDNSMDEMWFVIGAYPGFLCGVLFYAALAIAERGRRLGAVSLARAGALGAVSGALVGVLPFVLGDSETVMPAWMFAAIVIAVFTLASTGSAVATVLVARMWRQRSSIQPAGS